MKLFKSIPVILFIILCSTKLAFSSEITGNFQNHNGDRIPQNTKLIVNCGKSAIRTTLFNSNGSYSIRGLPSSRGCSYQIKFPDNSQSIPITFNSGNGVVRISGILRRHKNRILVVPR